MLDCITYISNLYVPHIQKGLAVFKRYVAETVLH